MVALLAEGVDRNIFGRFSPCTADVALLAEGVDRNTEAPQNLAELQKSPSSRRAWIEISRSTRKASSMRSVALLAEGVDRNFRVLAFFA